MSVTSDKEIAPAPIFITVGPMCSGKSTLLSSLSIKDVTIDDQDCVYRKIHYPSFLNPSFKDEEIVFNKTLTERVTCTSQTELRLILMRLLGILPPVEFQRELQNLLKGKDLIVSDLLLAMEEFTTLHPQYTIPDDFHVDLFIPEAIFQPKTGALDQAQAKLSSLSSSRDVPIAWGNTNTKPRDYETALQIAERMNRPVQFVVYAPLQDIVPDQSVIFLPQLQRKTLFFRNIQRFAQTGRYINAPTIASSEQRCKFLVESALNNTVPLTVLERIQRNIKSKDDLLFELDAALCALAGYEMNLERMVRYVGRSRDIGASKSSTVPFNNTSNYDCGARGRPTHYFSNGTYAPYGARGRGRNSTPSQRGWHDRPYEKRRDDRANKRLGERSQGGRWNRCVSSPVWHSRAMSSKTTFAMSVRHPQCSSPQEEQETGNKE